MYPIAFGLSATVPWTLGSDSRQTDSQQTSKARKQQANKTTNQQPTNQPTSQQTNRATNQQTNKATHKSTKNQSKLGPRSTQKSTKKSTKNQPKLLQNRSWRRLGASWEALGAILAPRGPQEPKQPPNDHFRTPLNPPKLEAKIHPKSIWSPSKKRSFF